MVLVERQVNHPLIVTPLLLWFRCKFPLGRPYVVHGEICKLLAYGNQAVHFVKNVYASGEPATCVVAPFGVPPVVLNHGSPVLAGVGIVKVAEMRVVDKSVGTQRQVDGPLRDGTLPAAMKDESQDDAERGQEAHSPG